MIKKNNLYITPLWFNILSLSLIGIIQKMKKNHEIRFRCPKELKENSDRIKDNFAGALKLSEFQLAIFYLGLQHFQNQISRDKIPSFKQLQDSMRIFFSK